MSTHPNSIRCPWCGAQPTEPCQAPAGPGKKKKLFVRSPLRFTDAHPSRIEAALRLDGAGDGEVERKVAGHLAAATLKYRDDPRNSPVPLPPTPGKPQPQRPPEQPPAATTAPATTDSGGTP
jgi:hypothetical protein